MAEVDNCVGTNAFNLTQRMVRQHAEWFNVDTVQCAVNRCHDDVQRVATVLGWALHMLHHVERCQQVGKAMSTRVIRALHLYVRIAADQHRAHVDDEHLQ